MPEFKKNKSAFMMKGKSPMMKALIGDQDKLPVELQKKIIASPARMYGKKHSPIKGYGKKSAMKNYKKGYYGL
jgi:hypothetical protein